jgi:quercetin dioxygenase-like cupin family protein
MTGDATTTARVLRAGAGDVAGEDGEPQDRFLIDGAEAGGRFALVEHLLPPRALAGPLHRHTREDEYSFILEGTVGALLGDEEVVGVTGDLIFKPRDQWHTFWNAGDTPARVLEIISPAGLEQLFRRMGVEGMPGPEEMAQWAAEYGAQVDFEGTGSIVERHALAF